MYGNIMLLVTELRVRLNAMNEEEEEEEEDR